MTQEGLADSSGVSQSQISAIENEKEGAGLQALSRLATALRCSIASLNESLENVVGGEDVRDYANLIPAFDLDGNLLGSLPVAGTADFCLLTPEDLGLGASLPDSSAGIFELSKNEPERGEVVASGPAPFLIGKYGISIVETPRRRLYRLVGFLNAGGCDPKRFLLPAVTK
jgi:transcriptional regulator with XRE-family HTH domain